MSELFCALLMKTVGLLLTVAFPRRSDTHPEGTFVHRPIPLLFLI
jgi:hypothetical protein